MHVSVVKSFMQMRVAAFLQMTNAIHEWGPIVYPPSRTMIISVYIHVHVQAKSRKYRGIFEEHSPVK